MIGDNFNYNKEQSTFEMREKNERIMPMTMTHKKKKKEVFFAEDH